MIRVTEFRLALALLAVAGCSADVTSPSRHATEGGSSSSASLLPGLLPGLLPVDTSRTALISCPGSSTQSATSRIGFAGGVLTVGNTTVVIPLGAVLFPEDFTLTVPASPYAEIRVRTGSAEHYVFQTPVTMTIDYSRCATPALDQRALSVWNIDPDSKALLAPMVSVDEKLTHTILFTTIHLSGYAVADRTAEDSTGMGGI
jgi:hypothetical protein